MSTAPAVQGTYDAVRAARSTLTLSDPIHWSPEYSYRDVPYRQLHHQDGIIGRFSIRLLEARDLLRSHWSPLALGPVKHLGLSTAHGPVSSYGTFWLGFRKTYEGGSSSSGGGSTSGTPQPGTPLSAYKPSQLPPRVPPSPSRLSEGIISRTADDHGSDDLTGVGGRDEFRSSTVRRCDDPRWPSAQTPDVPDGNVSLFDIPLRKGAMPCDGMRATLEVRMDEEGGAAEAIPVPGFGRIGGDGCIGRGRLDVTALLLGMNGPGEDRSGGGVWDVWVDLTQPSAVSDGAVPAALSAGSVRVLVSYQPNGLSPRRGDAVALECFARRPSSGTVQSVLPALAPLRVFDMKGSYVRVDFNVAPMDDERGRRKADVGSGSRGKSRRRRGSLCLHRNAVFVIERYTLLDWSVDMALTPTDVVFSTPLGRRTRSSAMPYVEAAGDLTMPVVLSGRLLWAAARTGMTASLTGLKAAGMAVLEEQDPISVKKRRERSYTG